MAQTGYLGEFEQMLLLAILRADDGANGYGIRKELEETAGREVSKSAFYVTSDRLHEKGYIEWEIRAPEDGPSTAPQRHFRVTELGLAELRKSLGALNRLTAGLEAIADL